VCISDSILYFYVNNKAMNIDGNIPDAEMNEESFHDINITIVNRR
jgi:hypothetical protein